MLPFVIKISVSSIFEWPLIFYFIQTFTNQIKCQYWKLFWGKEKFNKHMGSPESLRIDYVSFNTAQHLHVYKETHVVK